MLTRGKVTLLLLLRQFVFFPDFSDLVGSFHLPPPTTQAVPISSSLKSSVGLSTSTVAHASTHIDESPTASSSSIPASSSASSSIDPTQTYSLAKECIGDTFFNCFTSSSTIDAIDAGIASVNGTSAYLRLDSWVDLEQGQDRPMLQFESEISFENALIVIDVPKVPFGCGTVRIFPFFRGFGSEIDIASAT